MWETKKGLVFIHSFSQFQKRMSGEPHLEAVGFPETDVFVFDESWLERAQREGSAAWAELVPYNGSL